MVNLDEPTTVPVEQKPVDTITASVNKPKSSPTGFKKSNGMGYYSSHRNNKPNGQKANGQKPAYQNGKTTNYNNNRNNGYNSWNQKNHFNNGYNNYSNGYNYYSAAPASVHYNNQNGSRNGYNKTNNADTNHQANTDPNRQYQIKQIDDIDTLLHNPIPKTYHRSTDIKLASEKENSEPEQKRKLFIGGLSYLTDDKMLFDHFSKYGELTDCVVMKDPRTKRSRGFGFVCFQESGMLEKCMADRPHTLNNRPVEPKRAVSRLESAKPGANRSVTKLHCAWNPPDELKAKDFREYFSKYGNIKEVEIPKNKDTGEAKHFAFITFDDYDIVDKIIACGKKAIQENARNSIPVKSTSKSEDEAEPVEPVEPEPEAAAPEVEPENPEPTTEEPETTTSNSEEAEPSIILSQVKPKDLINQHIINGVTCRVNKGFTNDEMKELKYNMQEKHAAMERAKAKYHSEKYGDKYYGNHHQNGDQQGHYHNRENNGYNNRANNTWGDKTTPKKPSVNGSSKGSPVHQNGTSPNTTGKKYNNRNGYPVQNNRDKNSQYKRNTHNSGNSTNNSKSVHNSPGVLGNYHQHAAAQQQFMYQQAAQHPPVTPPAPALGVSGGHVTHNPPHYQKQQSHSPVTVSETAEIAAQQVPGQSPTTTPVSEAVDAQVPQQAAPVAGHHQHYGYNYGYHYPPNGYGYYPSYYDGSGYAQHQAAPAGYPNGATAYQQPATTTATVTTAAPTQNGQPGAVVYSSWSYQHSYLPQGVKPSAGLWIPEGSTANAETGETE